MATSPSTGHATGLRCFRCGGEHAIDPDAYLCTACGPGGGGEDPGVLDVRYDYAAAAPRLRADLSTGGPGEGMWRYAALLPATPAADLPLTGGTPLVAAPRLARALGIGALLLKDETRNPTRCLKDRATAVAVSMAAGRGGGPMVCASAGNAAISLAGFCAGLGLECHAFVPAQASEVRLDWLRRYGAEVHRSEGNYDQAFAESERMREERGWYSRNCAFNPFLVEGKKTVAFEIAEQLDWRVPDLVVSPVGDGCTLGAVGKGFRELLEVGLVDRIPRLLGVQAEGVRPLVERAAGRRGGGDGTTRAASIAVGEPRNALRLLAELEASGGSLVAVPDAEMEEAQRRLAREAGLVAELTSAATLAGVARLAAEEDLSDATVVLIVTGGRPD